MRRLLLPALLLLVAVMPVAAAQGTEIPVLFDFGDGRYAWGLAGFAEASKDAWNVTVLAADSIGYGLDFTVFPFGAQLDAVDNETAAWPVWWHFLVWNATGSTWEMAALGASDTTLADGDAIAWLRVPDDPVTYAFSSPAATPVFPHPWTSFRGTIRGEGVATTPGPTFPAVVWSYDTGDREAEGTPMVYRDRVVFATENGLFALRRGTGEVVWSRPDLKGMSSPAYWNDGLVVGAMDGRLHQVRGSDGGELWNVTLADAGRMTLSSSPTVHENVAYVGMYDEDGGYGALFAVDLFGRSIAWRLNTSSIHYSSAAVAGGKVFIGVTGLYNRSADRWDPPYGLLAANLTGGLAWFHPTDGPVASSPAVDGDRIYVTSRGSRLYAIGLDGGELWNATIGYSTSSPAVAGGRVFVGSGSIAPGGKVRAFTREGVGIWETSLDGGVQSAVVHSQGRVYVTTNSAAGSVYSLNATDGSVVWRWQADPAQYLLGSVTITDGRLHVGVDSGYVYEIISAGPPFPPTNVTVAAGEDRVTVTWTPPSFDGGTPITAYRIYRGNDAANLTLLIEVVPGERAVEDRTVTAGRTYEYRVVAVNAAGEGTPSPTFSALPYRGPSIPVAPAVLGAVILVAAVMVVFVVLARRRSKRS